MRDALNCKSFDWYLQNIYADLHIPDDLEGYYGALESSFPYAKGYKFCLDYNPPDHQPTRGVLSSYPCHGQGGNQFFEMTAKGEIRYGFGGVNNISLKTLTNIIFSKHLFIKPPFHNHEKELCITINAPDSGPPSPTLKVDACQDINMQLFTFEKDTSKQIKSKTWPDRCLALSNTSKDSNNFPKIVLEPCVDDSSNQKWQFN